MKKLLLALTAAIGMGAASVPASAGGSISISGSYYAPSYGYSSYYAPNYGYTNYGYAVPSYRYVAPRYYSYGSPSVSFSFGKSYYKPHRKYRKHRKHHRHHGHRHQRNHYKHW
jgi:hypothetical protein